LSGTSSISTGQPRHLSPARQASVARAKSAARSLTAPASRSASMRASRRERSPADAPAVSRDSGGAPASRSS
jgi:hypothetical protein